MTKETFLKGIAIFLSTFRNIDLDKKTQEVWYILLKDLEDERFEYAIKRICREAREFKYLDNFVAIIIDYAELYVYPERKQLISYEMSAEAHKIRIDKFKKKFKSERGIDYDSLGDTEREKCIAYVGLLKKEYLKSIKNVEDKPLKQNIFDVIDKI